MNEQVSQAEARKRILRYNLQKSIDKSGDAMTTPGLLLGGITGAGIGGRSGNLRGALAGAAIGAPLGMVGLRLSGRLEEKRRLAGMLQPTEKKLSALEGEKIREFAGGYINTSQGVAKEDSISGHLRRHAGAYVGTLVTPGLGTGVGWLIDRARKRTNLIKTADENPVSAKTAALLAGERLMGSNLKPALRELAARSGRIVEFGDGDADEAVLSALKAVASADESSAQRAMLLKRGLIEMVKGQVVITERGYEMMQKAGVPPKLTPEERREEIAGTEEKRLSMFDHGGHREHRVEFARGDWLKKLYWRVSAAGGPAGKVPQNVINANKNPQFPLRGSSVASELAGAARWVKNNIRGR